MCRARGGIAGGAARSRRLIRVPADDDHGSLTAAAGGVAPRAPVGPGHLRAAELYDAWLFAESDATLALAAWWSAPSTRKGAAYAAYVAALEREDEAAGLLQLRLSPIARAAPA